MPILLKYILLLNFKYKNASINMKTKLTAVLIKQNN